MDLSNEQEPLDFNLLLVSSTVMLGEPILLAYETTNLSDSRRKFYLGRDHNKWIALDLVDHTGQSVPARFDPRTPQGGMYSVHAGVSPNEHYTGFLVVTRELTVPHSGRYNLNVEARLPDHRFPVPQHEMIFFRAQSFALNVVPPDSAKLQEIAEAFRQAAVMESDFNQRITAVRALLSMPEQYALASWQALAEDARFRHGEVLMNELARAMTPSAADVLAFLWVAGPGSLVLGNLSTVLLDNMYRAGDDALKQHIKEIFSQRGKAISNHPLMFVGA